MKLTYTEDYNDRARQKQQDDFVDALCNKALSCAVSHNNVYIEDQMHNCRIDDRKINNDKFQVIITVEYYRDI